MRDSAQIDRQIRLKKGFRCVAFDSVLQLLERQRAEHEHLLRALATDLTSEIRGEKVKFIEAMRDATSVNVNREFSSLLP